MNTVDSIVKMIDEAVNKTREAQAALQGAEINAQIARDAAKEAQTKYAEEASKVLSCFEYMLTSELSVLHSYRCSSYFLTFADFTVFLL